MDPRNSPANIKNTRSRRISMVEPKGISWIGSWSVCSSGVSDGSCVDMAAGYPGHAGASTDPVSSRKSLVLIGVLIAVLGLGARASQADSEARIQSENPSKGKYRITASATIPGSPVELAQVIADFPSQCESGCGITVPSIDQAEIVHGSFEQGLMGTWTHIDDVLDASYWTTVIVTRTPDRVVLRLRTPEASELERWQSRERPHEPFFHHQDGVWVLERQGSGTHIEHRMELRSDRLMVNLMPSKVLKGAERHVTRILDHLRSLQTAAPPSTD